MSNVVNLNGKMIGGIGRDELVQDLLSVHHIVEFVRLNPDIHPIDRASMLKGACSLLSCATGGVLDETTEHADPES